jgi:hypothetical protein
MIFMSFRSSIMVGLMEMLQVAGVFDRVEPGTPRVPDIEMGLVISSDPLILSR